MREKYDPGDLSRNEAYELAGVERRRSLLRSLDDDGEQTVDSLVDEIVTDVHEDADGSAAIPPESVRVALLHTDLPKLVAQDVVVYDACADVVAPGENIDDMYPLV